MHTCGHAYHLLINLCPLLLRHVCEQLLPLPLKLLCCLGRLALPEVLLQEGIYTSLLRWSWCKLLTRLKTHAPLCLCWQESRVTSEDD